MADVFISYSRDDRPRVEQLAEALQLAPDATAREAADALTGERTAGMPTENHRDRARQRAQPDSTARRTTDRIAAFRA
jgi:hypothetical protein